MLVCAFNLNICITFGLVSSTQNSAPIYKPLMYLISASLSSNFTLAELRQSNFSFPFPELSFSPRKKSKSNFFTNFSTDFLTANEQQSLITVERKNSKNPNNSTMKNGKNRSIRDLKHNYGMVEIKHKKSKTQKKISTRVIFLEDHLKLCLSYNFKFF